MNTTYIIGIDPGQSGAAALLAPDGRLVNVVKFNGATPHDIGLALEEYGSFGDNVKAYMEAVHSMPKQGVASSFKFGKSAGMLEGMLIALKIPYTMVTPAKWQGAVGCRSKGDKNVTKAAAQRLYPHEKIIHANADAILIAAYGRKLETMNG